MHELTHISPLLASIQRFGFVLEEVSVNEAAGQLEVCAEMISQGPLLQSVLLGIMPQDGSARG